MQMAWYFLKKEKLGLWKDKKTQIKSWKTKKSYWITELYVLLIFFCGLLKSWSLINFSHINFLKLHLWISF